MTLVGFARGDDLVVYSRALRIDMSLLDDEAEAMEPIRLSLEPIRCTLDSLVKHGQPDRQLLRGDARARAEAVEDIAHAPQEVLGAENACRIAGACRRPWECGQWAERHRLRGGGRASATARLRARDAASNADALRASAKACRLP